MRIVSQITAAFLLLLLPFLLMLGMPQPNDWTGQVVWPRAESVPVGVEAAVYKHPAVVPYDFPSKDDVPVLLVRLSPIHPLPSLTKRPEPDANGYPQITSFGGKPLIDAHPNNKQARLEHIPICGTTLHPDNGRILHLADARMRLKEYSCVNVSKVHWVPRQHLVPYDRDQVHKLHKDSLKLLKEAISHLPHTKHTGGKHGLSRAGESKSEGQEVPGRPFTFTRHDVNKTKHTAAAPATVVLNGKKVRVPGPNNQDRKNGTGPGCGSRDDISGGKRNEGGDANDMQPGASQGPVKKNQGESTGSSIKPGKTRSRAKGGSQRDIGSSFRQSSAGIQRSLTPNQHAGIGKAPVVGPVDHNATDSEPELPETAGEHLRNGDMGPRQDGGLVIRALHPEGLTWGTFLRCLSAFLFLIWVAYLALWGSGL